MQTLAHHGIKGQKWGKRNGPPYPLSDKAARKVAKKIIKQDQKIAQTNYYTEEYKKLQNEMPFVKEIKDTLPYAWHKSLYDGYIRRHVDTYKKNKELYTKMAARASYEYDTRGGATYDKYLERWKSEDDEWLNNYKTRDKNPFEFYLLSIGELKNYNKDIKDLEKEIENAGKGYIDSVLGKNKNLGILYSDSVSKKTVESMIMDCIDAYDKAPYVEDYSDSDLQQMKRIVKMYMK